MKKKLIVLTIVGVLVAAGVATYFKITGEKSHDGNLVLYGNVEVRDALLTFNEQELVADVLVEEGDAVTAGQELAHLRSQQLEAQLGKAEAEADAQAEVVAQLESGSRTQEVRQGQAEVKAAQVRVQNARITVQRLEQTIAVGAVSKQALDDARAELNVAQAQLNVARQNLDLLRAGPRQEEIRQAQAQLQAGRYAVSLLQERLQDTTLKAPFDGVIQSRILEPGEMAGPSRPAFILARTDQKWVRAYVSEPDMGRIKEGMRARVASDSWENKTFSGQVGFISSVAEFTPKSVETTDLRTKLVYEVRIYVTDPDNELRLGMPVSVEFGDDSARSD